MAKKQKDIRTDLLPGTENMFPSPSHLWHVSQKLCCSFLMQVMSTIKFRNDVHSLFPRKSGRSLLCSTQQGNQGPDLTSKPQSSPSPGTPRINPCPLVTTPPPPRGPQSPATVGRRMSCAARHLTSRANLRSPKGASHHGNPCELSP